MKSDIDLEKGSEGGDQGMVPTTKKKLSFTIDNGPGKEISFDIITPGKEAVLVIDSLKRAKEPGDHPKIALLPTGKQVNIAYFGQGMFISLLGQILVDTNDHEIAFLRDGKILFSGTISLINSYVALIEMGVTVVLVFGNNGDEEPDRVLLQAELFTRIATLP